MFVICVNQTNFISSFSTCSVERTHIDTKAGVKNEDRYLVMILVKFYFLRQNLNLKFNEQINLERTIM